MALTSDMIFADNDANVPKPSGYTDPTTAISQTDPITFGPYTYEMTASSGVSTTATLGMDALISAFETWFSGTFIPTTLGIDTTGNTVTAIARVSKITVGDGGDPGDEIYLNDATRVFSIEFTATVEVS